MAVPMISALLLPALLLPSLATAITLGDIEVHSAFGQPLRASVPVTISEGETLTKNCIYQPVVNRAYDDLQAIPQLDVSFPLTTSPGTHLVKLTGYESLTEPMYEVAIHASCGGTSSITRNFIVLLGIPGGDAKAPSAKTEELTTPTSSPATTPARTTRANDTVQSPAGNSTAPIPVNSSFRVAIGDTVSTLAERIEPAWGSNAQRSTAIFLANPNAFYNDDPAQIIAGAMIAIPTAMPPRGGSLPDGPSSGGAGPGGSGEPGNTPSTESIPDITNSALSATTNATQTTNTGNISRAEAAGASTDTASDKPSAMSEGETLAAALATARDAARQAQEAREAEAADKASAIADTTIANDKSAASTSSFATMMTGGVIAGLIICVFFVRWRTAKKQNKTLPVQEFVSRYSEENSVRDVFIAPVSEPEPDDILVNEDEDDFRKTIASDHMATSAFERMASDNSLLMPQDGDPDETHDPLDDTADEIIPKANVNNSFLDSNPDIFDGTASITETNTIGGASVQDIFDEALFKDPDDPDAPPEDRIKAAKDATENLQRLAKTAEEQDDEELSATLVEALNLLEQDYHDELSASQVLEKRRVEAAISHQGNAEGRKN